MKLNLPATIYSQQDLRSVTLEIRGYARWYSHTLTKQHFNSKGTTEPPVLSVGATELVDALRVKKDLTSNGLDRLIALLAELSDKAPKLTITLAAPAASGLKTILVGWCRRNIASDVLVSFSFNSTLLGGMVVRSGSHIYDWSFRRQILDARSKFPEVLRNV